MTTIGQTAQVWQAVLRLENLDPVPEPADVNAGTLGLVVLLALVAAVVVLVVLLNRQLRRVNRKADEGAYDDLPGPRGRGPAPRGDSGGGDGGEGIEPNGTGRPE